MTRYWTASADTSPQRLEPGHLVLGLDQEVRHAVPLERFLDLPVVVHVRLAELRHQDDHALGSRAVDRVEQILLPVGLLVDSRRARDPEVAREVPARERVQRIAALVDIGGDVARAERRAS
jgi:hypothetical protein